MQYEADYESVPVPDGATEAENAEVRVDYEWLLGGVT